MNPTSSTSKPRFINFLRKEWAGLLVLVLLFTFPYIYSLLTGVPVDGGPNKFWQGQLISFFIMAILAMSYDLMFGYTGILSFGHAAFFGGGAYTIALFLKFVAPRVTDRYAISIGGLDIGSSLMFAVGILVVLLVTALLGLIFSMLSSRVKGVYFAMITLAAAEAISIVLTSTDLVDITGADEGMHAIPVPLWLNPTQFRLRFFFIALIFLVVMYFVLRRITNSPTGRVLVALRENESRVQMMGYNPTTYRTIAFVISAMTAGLAGALYSMWNLSATPSMVGTLQTINALIMVILGGIGTLIGPILGAGLMQIVGQFFDQWFGPRWPLVFGILFIALVLFLPYGIVGTWRLRRLEIQSGWQRLRSLFTGKKE